MALHNWLFPSTEIRLEGFVEWKGGFYPILSQSDVASVRGATQAEVDAEMAKMGFVSVADRKARPHDYINPTTGVQVDDLHDENAVIESGTGAIAFLDPMEGMDRTSKTQRVLAEDQQLGAPLAE